MADFCGLGRFFGGFYAVFVYIGADRAQCYGLSCLFSNLYFANKLFFIPFVFAVVNLFDFGFGVR